MVSATFDIDMSVAINILFFPVAYPFSWIVSWKVICFFIYNFFLSVDDNNTLFSSMIGCLKKKWYSISWWIAVPQNLQFLFLLQVYFVFYSSIFPRNFLNTVVLSLYSMIENDVVCTPPTIFIDVVCNRSYKLPQTTRQT